MYKITIASGKGGTGKTFISTNLAYTYAGMNREVAYLDCDVEEPDGHLFLKPESKTTEEVKLEAPITVDNQKCTGCGKCAEACTYNAIAVIKEKAMIFPELCHICGGCSIVCPEDAIIKGQKKIGDLIHGKSGNLEIHYALLKRGEGGMSPRLISRVKSFANYNYNFFDSPPGTACPAVETVKDSDLVILVTDPTPFGVNDLKLSVQMCRTLGIEPAVIVNRANYRDGSLMEYCQQAELDVIGEIPDDREVAEVYSEGKLITAESEEYINLFLDLAEKIDKILSETRDVKKEVKPIFANDLNLEKSVVIRSQGGDKPSELVVISGKGGTGKTSITAAFATLSKDTVISDCDVDASDLPLILQPEIEEKGYFSGGYEVEIDQSKCVSCGRCLEECRFHAVKTTDKAGEIKYYIDTFACEGCGVCNLVCQFDAVTLTDAVNGEWFISKTRAGFMTHARLGMAEENSGRLVSLTRDKAALVASENQFHRALIDGSPGTGCPVIASLTGSDYALIITEPTVSGLHDLERILEVTAHFNIRTGVIVNKFDINKNMTEKIRKKIQKEDNISYLGELPYDDKFTEAQMQQQSIIEYAPDCEVSQKIRDIFERLSEVVYNKN